MAGEPVATVRPVVANDANHLVELGAHLNAAGETTVRRVGSVVTHQAFLLKGQGRVQLLVPGVRDHYAALGARDASGVEVDRDLIRL